MTSKPRTPSAAEDIAAQQTKLIQLQRQQINDLEERSTELIEQSQQQAQRISYLQEEVTEYRELKQAFGGNGNLTYYQAMAAVQTQRNATIQAQRNMINSQRQSKFEAERATAEAAKRDAILKEAPGLVEYCDERKTKATKDRDRMLDLATRFYDMTEEQLDNYARISHRPDASAVKHLINEYLEGEAAIGGKQFTVYECDYCEKKCYSLSDFERHCYNNGHNHRDVNLERIRNEAIESISAAQRELDSEVDKIIRYKANEEYKKFLQAERANDAKIAKSLPYANK